MLLQDISDFIWNQGKRCLCCVCKDTCSGKGLTLFLQLPLCFRFSSPQLCQKDPHQCECWTKCTFSLQRTAFTGNSVGAKGEKCRTPSEHQASVEIPAASSQDFLSCWRTAIKSSHYFESVLGWNYTADVPISVLCWETRVTIMAIRCVMSGEMNTIINNTERLKINCGERMAFATNRSSVRSILFCKHWWQMKNLSDLYLATCSLLQVLLHRSLPVNSGKLLIVPSVIKSLPVNLDILSYLFSSVNST